MEMLPLVSCIMPTAGRELFVPLAVKYFLRQNYANKELVVVDNGKEPIEALLAHVPNLRYERISGPRMNTGAIRNYACSLCRGEVIMHWDDDDWYADNWISSQVATLISTGAVIAGLSNIYFYEPLRGQSWKYIYPANEKAWVAGASMAYYRDFWRTHPFKDMRVGEDNFFVWESGCKVAASSYTEGLVALVHPGNTSPKHTGNVRWNPVSLQVLEQVMKNDFNIYSPAFFSGDY